MFSKGFTAIEAIIAIFILTVAVIGVYSSFSRMAISTSILSSRLIASYLAKEGIEVIRNIRDTNWLTPQNWDTNLTDCVAGCEVDYKSDALAAYNGKYLNIDANGFYSYSTGQATKFKRKITITPQKVKEEDEEYNILKVSALIEWQERGEPYNFSAEGYLYDWY